MVSGTEAGVLLFVEPLVLVSVWVPLLLKLPPLLATVVLLLLAFTATVLLR